MTVGGAGPQRRDFDPAWDRRRRKLSTGLKIPLDSGPALTANRLEYSGSAAVRRCRGSSFSPTVAKYSLLACDVGSICVPGPRPALCHRSAFVSDHQGARHWLIFSFSVRARALRFQPASRPSGFCSRAFPVSQCHCAARLADKCTSGNPTTLGSAPPGRPAMEISCRHPERRS
jgi:hypothetical protein